jgi:tetratricopeptide (TPR) repeat protein
MKTILNLAILLSFSTVVFSQSPLKNFREGNRLFHDGHFNEAEILFRRGLQADSTDVRGRFNLANSIYKQNEFEKSAELYDQLLNDRRLSNRQKSNVLHNLGNSLVQKENYEDAVKSYKEAMKLNPNDDTRYNLAYALQRLQQQQQNQDQNQQNQDKNNEQDQQQQQQQNNQDQNQQNQQQRQNQGHDDQKKQGESSQPDQLKQGDAERMLNAMERQEKNTLDKRKQTNVQQRRTEKDW